MLSRNALDALDYSRRNTSSTLEDVQAHIFMSFITYHVDGFSARGRILLTTAISIARELRLHRLDAETESPNAENQSNASALIDLEIKRRVFWHLAATDWLSSTISGPQEGMYLINPCHVNVRAPQDCADDDLALGERTEVMTEPRPTSMTFFLGRLQLAHLSREIADTVPLDTSKLIEMPYEQIICLDGKLKGFISSLPYFLRLDVDSRKRSNLLETIYPNIPISRYCIIAEAYSRRCKLHQRFLLRQCIDPRYVYSRQACLESARAVVQVYQDLHQYDSSSTVPELMGMAVHFTHLALVVMVMDLCFNKNEADEGEIKSQVRTALRIFEDAKSISPLAGQFLTSLSEVLAKHKVQLTDASTLSSSNVEGRTQDITINGLNNLPEHEEMPFLSQSIGTQSLGIDLDTSYDEFWQAVMQGEEHPDSDSWDNLFSAVDSRPF
ncbi:Fc.00g056750.m01.CDS01 [Cosmosporella sp. VM-42]